MSRRADTPRTRADFHAADGVLVVVRNPPPASPPAKGQPGVVASNPAEGVEILIAVWDDGTVTAQSGHVDLGTGLATALAQITAEELDVALVCVNVVLGDTTRAPNQGSTIASASIQIHADPIRRAAAQARRWLVARAAERLQVDADALVTEAGHVALASGERRIAYGELVRGEHAELLLDPQTPVKDWNDYRIVGTSQARLDIPGKTFGDRVFVHDMRMPGMLHGRVVRPPYAGADHGDFIGNTLQSVDESSIAHIRGIREVVVIRDFVGIVAEREEEAEQALDALVVHWKSWPDLTDLTDLPQALRANTATRRELIDEGDVDAALARAAMPMPRTYLWPYQLHASIGPSCAVADWQGDRMQVWAGTQNPHQLRADLALLMQMPDTAIDVVRMEAAGCYGRNCADDVAADAALLSRAVGAPVRVQLTRAQEHLWEPKGAAQLMEVDGGLDADGSVAAYDFVSSYPSNGAPTLALLLTRTIDPLPHAFEMGDRSARPPYAYANLRVAVNDMPPIVRASWLRGVSALPSTFAHESYIDELATAAGADPVEFRLRHLGDRRAVELVQATAAQAGWKPHTAPQQQPADGDFLKGQGFAYARYVHSKWPGYGAAWAAWVADVDVDRKTGEVHVRRVVVGHDAGMLVNPAGVEHQIHGNVLQTTSRALKEKVSFVGPGGPAAGTVETREWGSYPILGFREVPVIEVMHMPRPGEAALGAGESASVPGTAAIANAIFDATGVRFRSPPFTPETVRAALHPLAAPASSGDDASATKAETAFATGLTPTPPHDAPWPRRRGLWTHGSALVAGAIGMGAAMLGWRSAIAPVETAVANSASMYSAAIVARGREVAAAGDCIVCHTAPGGTPNAGGRAMHTDFGTVYSTNLTPDVGTGIGAWPLRAFERAMREGVSIDGHHLYPAFPYTAFARIGDDDMTALYAYLMAQPAVKATVPPSKLDFPFGIRPLMAGWNALFHDATPYRADPAKSAEWNRGAYLVTGAGHCGACHTPRNALGAEKTGEAFLAGAIVDGWEAPALTALSKAPVPWTADALHQYLRTGYSAEHGAALGPMGPVVQQMQQLPDADVRAMAVYLASFNNASVDASQQARDVVASATDRAPLPDAAQRMFESACGACHHDGEGPRLLGTNVPLALNTTLHSDTPDNVLHAILDGVQAPATPHLGFMPAFRNALNDRQIADLTRYLRRRFAPGRPAWDGIETAVARVRSVPPESRGAAPR